ncbi:MAG: outer membrane beta-barrel protein [Ignavibacteria bacterium]|nr:outer membrane beta-barrel protein [Ignavibacteria bacterium]
MNTRTAFITLATLLLCALPLRADGPDAPGDRILFPGSVRMLLVGPYGGIDYNMHKGTFSTTENGQSCCTFEEGTGIGLVAGLKAFIPLTDNLDFSPRLLYENRGGDFTALLQRYPIRGRNNAVEFADLENTLDITLHTFTIDVFASYRFTSFGMYVTAGPSMSFLFGDDYIQTETILGPPGVVYIDGTTTKQMFSGTLDITESMLFAVRGGLGVIFPVSDNIRLNPEVLYSFPLTKLSKDGDWKVSSVQATIGVLFAF